MGHFPQDPGGRYLVETVSCISGNTHQSVLSMYISIWISCNSILPYSLKLPPTVSKYFHTIKGCLWADETNIWGEGKRREEGGQRVGLRTRSSEKQHLSLGKLIQSGPPQGPQSHAVMRAVRQVPVRPLPPYTTPGPGLWSKAAQIYSLDIAPLFHRNVPV